MAINKKLTDKEEIFWAADGDFLHVIDVSDLTGSPQGTSKKIKKSNLLLQRILPTAIPNSLSITGIAEQNVEVGVLFDDALVVNYDRGIIESKNGAPDIPLTGEVTSQEFSGTGIDVATGAISTRILLGTSNQWEATVNYAAGTGLYYDSFGDVATNLNDLRVVGVISQDSPIITGLYKYWVYTGAVGTSPTTSAAIRVLTNNGFSEKKTFDVIISAEQSEVSIYIPQTFFLLSVLYIESALANITGTFTASAITVNDAEGVSVNYTKYTQEIGGSGYPADATYRITLTDIV